MRCGARVAWQLVPFALAAGVLLPLAGEVPERSGGEGGAPPPASIGLPPPPPPSPGEEPFEAGRGGGFRGTKNRVPGIAESPMLPQASGSGRLAVVVRWRPLMASEQQLSVGAFMDYERRETLEVRLRSGADLHRHRHVVDPPVGVFEYHRIAE